MNVKTFIAAAAAVLVTAPVLAQESPVFNDDYGTPKTRAEVKAELADYLQAQREARLTGRVDRGEAVVFIQPKVEMTRSRAEVAAEARMAAHNAAYVHSGDAARTDVGEAIVFADTKSSPVSRAEVRAEAVRAVRELDSRFPG